MSTRELQLAGDIRQAIENAEGDQVSGPWDVVIEQLADMVANASINSLHISKLTLAFDRINNTEPDVCPACERGLTRHDGMRW